jgi:hypothetical protein
MSATTSSNAGDPVLGLEAAAARQRFRRRERADGLVRDASLDHGLTFRITGGDTSWEPGRAIGLGIGSAAVDAATDPAWVASLMHGEMAQKPPAGKRGHVAARQSALHPAQGASARSNESEGKRLAMTEAVGFRGPPRRHPEVPERSEGLEGCCSAVQLLCCASFEARPTSSGKRSQDDESEQALPATTRHPDQDEGLPKFHPVGSAARPVRNSQSPEGLT